MISLSVRVISFSTAAVLFWTKTDLRKLENQLSTPRQTAKIWRPKGKDLSGYDRKFWGLPSEPTGGKDFSDEDLSGNDRKFWGLPSEPRGKDFSDGHCNFWTFSKQCNKNLQKNPGASLSAEKDDKFNF